MRPCISTGLKVYPVLRNDSLACALGLSGWLVDTVTAQFVAVHARDLDVDVNGSSNGPEMRFWYFVTIAGAQVQGFWLSP